MSEIAKIYLNGRFIFRALRTNEQGDLYIKYKNQHVPIKIDPYTRLYYIAIPPCKPRTAIAELEEEHKQPVSKAAYYASTNQTNEIKGEIVMTNQTINQNSNWNAIDSTLSTLAEGKSDMDKIFTPIYTCKNYIDNDFCESIITDNEAYAMQCDDYEFISLSELNNVAAPLGKVFDGVLLVDEGLCEYESGEYRLLSDISHYGRFTSGHELYVNQLYNTCNVNVNSFIEWMTEVYHYSIDGYIVRNLKQYIDSKSKLTAFFERFANVYKYDTDMLTQCSIDMIDFYKANPTLQSTHK